LVSGIAWPLLNTNIKNERSKYHSAADVHHGCSNAGLLSGLCITKRIARKTKTTEQTVPASGFYGVL